MQKIRVIIGIVIVLAVAFAVYALRTPAAPSEDVAATAARIAAEEQPPPLVNGAPEVRTFAIDPAQSRALFQLDETLRGQAMVVEGATSAIAGQVTLREGGTMLDFGRIAVNARTLVTDDPNRDRAIANIILNTAEHEFIAFAPDGPVALSAPLGVGTEYAITIPGVLTIRDVARPVVFSATVTAPNVEMIAGTATATVFRSDYGLIIPDLPFIASVGDEVTIIVVLTATRSE